MRFIELNIAHYLQYNKFIEIENIGLFWVHISGKKPLFKLLSAFPLSFTPFPSF